MLVSLTGIKAEEKYTIEAFNPRLGRWVPVKFNVPGVLATSYLRHWQIARAVAPKEAA